MIQGVDLELLIILPHVLVWMDVVLIQRMVHKISSLRATVEQQHPSTSSIVECDLTSHVRVVSHPICPRYIPLVWHRGGGGGRGGHVAHSAQCEVVLVAVRVVVGCTCYGTQANEPS